MKAPRPIVCADCARDIHALRAAQTQGVLELTDRFRLAICFQSRRVIEIESDSVGLIPVLGDAFPERDAR